MIMLAACLIVKNEEKSIARCLSGILPYCEDIFVVDTGSTDQTLAILSELSKLHENIHVHNFQWINDFSAAREYSFSLVSPSTDWVFWLDADDVIDSKDFSDAKKRLNELDPGINTVMLPYNYVQDEFGNCLCMLKRERFLRITTLKSQGGYGRWHGAVHEAFRVPNLCAVHWDSPVILHQRNDIGKDSSFDRNIKILEAEYAKFGDSDQRVMLHLGSEYKRARRFDEAIEAFMKFAEKTTFIEEKYWAIIKAAQSCTEQNKFVDCFDMCLQALTVNPAWPDAWLIGGMALTSMNQPDAAIRWFDEGFSRKPMNTHLYLNPLEYNFIPYMAQQMAYANLGRFADAAEVCRKAMAIRPDEVFKHNLGIYEKELALVEAEKALIKKATAVDKDDYTLTTISEQEPELRDRTEVVRLRKRVSDKRNTQPTIVTSVTVNFEQWGPNNPNNVGIGGSETAIVRMMEELNDDYRCIVYNRVKSEDEGVSPSGVEYWRPELYTGEHVHAFIASRYTECFEANVQAKIRAVWLQDVHCGGLTPYRDTRIDRYLVLTEWHKKNFCRLYPFVDPKKVFLTFNGIDLAPFWEPKVPIEKKDPHKCMYVSSPDRGLEYLLEIWPQIVKRVPTATLDIYYGFDNIDKLIASGRDDLAELKSRIMTKVDRYDSVTYHGRVGQTQLAKAWRDAAIWLYPTAFCETSCISALQAQAGGALVLTTPLAALPEVASGAYFINGHAGSESYQTAFAKKAVELLNISETKRQQRQSIGFEFVRTRTWELAAKQWLENLL